MRTFLFFLIIPVFLITSCQKNEGIGGRATITGKVLVREYNYDYSILKSSYYAQAEDVYIMYGDENMIGDKTDTHFDGSFQFEYLQKGFYTIYVYSDDKDGNSTSGQIAIELEVTIDNAKEIVDVGEIVIFKSTKENSGSSSVTGKVYTIDYNIDFTFIESQYYEAEEDVYLIYGQEEFYMDDLKTNYDGSYTFKDLPIGSYRVYAYSKDRTFTIPSGIYPVFKSFTITEANQNIELEDIVIYK